MLWKGSYGEMGNWKSLGGSEGLTSVLLGIKRKSKQDLILWREVFRVLPHCNRIPIPVGSLEAPSSVPLAAGQ